LNEWKIGTLTIGLLLWRHESQYNGTKHNDTQHNLLYCNTRYNA
jgi:hypothetical protein